MSNGVLFTGDNYQSLKNDGTINTSGTLTFYSPGTTTLKTVYANQALVTPITNPVTLDSHGRATVFLDGTNYDLYVKDSAGTLLYSVLNIYTPPTATASMGEWTGNSQDSATSYSGTQVSGTSFTIATDVTSYFHVGRRIKVIQGGTTVYGYIVSSSYVAPNTTVTTINDTGASFPAGSLTVYLSLLRADNHALPATASYVLESSDAGATVGPAFTLDRNSASPAASDVLGGILLNGRNSGAASKTYAQIQGEIIDPTAASEDGQITLWAMVAGALTKLGTFNSTNGFNSVYGLYDNSKKVSRGFTWIETQTPAASTSILFATSLQVQRRYRLMGRITVSASDSAAIRFNNDVGANYGVVVNTTDSVTPANTAASSTGSTQIILNTAYAGGDLILFDVEFETQQGNDHDVIATFNSSTIRSTRAAFNRSAGSGFWAGAGNLTSVTIFNYNAAGTFTGILRLGIYDE